MENEQAQQPASVATPEADFDLGSYRAKREAKTPVKEAAQETATQETIVPDAGADDAPETETTPEQLEAKKKKLGGFQKTISRQSEEIAELKRQLATGKPPEAAKPAETAKAEGTAENKPAIATPAQPDYEKVKAKPKLEDCADLGEFTEKMADWNSDRRDWLKEQKTKADTQKAAVTTLQDNWKAKTAEFKVENPDYDAVMAGVDDVKLSPLHQALFLESEHGVALAYQLAQDPDELKRIAALPPLKAAVAIGKLEAAFAKAAEEAENEAAPEPEIKVSGAPKPFKPVNGAMTRGTPNVATLSPEDYRKARESGRIH